MTKKEAIEMVAGIHKDTYDNTVEIIGLLEDKSLKEAVVRNQVNTEMNIKEAEKTLSKDHNFIIVLLCIIGALICVLYLKLISGIGNIEKHIEDKPANEVNVIVQEEQHIAPEKEIENFKISTEHYFWSDNVITSTNELARDFTITQASLNATCHVYHITNDVNYEIIGNSPEQTMQMLLSRWDVNREHRITKRVSKVIQDIQLDYITVMKKGDYIIEYFDLK